jgi:hypothetical protein
MDYKNDYITLPFVNPLTKEKETLSIYNGERDRHSLKRLQNYNSQEELINIIDSKIAEMDCSKLVDGMPLVIIASQKYKNILSDIWYYLNKLENNLLHNDYISRIIENHQNNIIIETERYERPVLKDKKGKSKAKPNRFIRTQTKDLFTGEIVYIYENLKTGERIKSSDGNMLDELNKKAKTKTKTAKVKSTAVPMSAMTFKF